MSIDLGSKPEGATHISPHNGLWIKYLGGGGGHYQFFKDGQWEMGFGCMSNSYLEIAKPEPWTGEGLPPVGTVCEWNPNQDGLVEVEILGHDGEETWFRRAGESISETCMRMAFFRPIRTAEQIAAEERKTAIEEMVYGACGCEPGGGNTSPFLICGLLYDYGYRKQVQP